MKSKIVLGIMAWLAFALPAFAADPNDLLNVAKNGDIAGIQSALQAGVDINTRFAAGKTALIVATEKGQDGAVATLMDAGADLYVLDNNHWDALTHAMFRKDLSTFHLLLRKGYDPSKNNWRALSATASLAGPIRTQAPKLDEARKTLEAARAKGPSQATPVVAGQNTTTALVTYLEETAAPILIDVSERKITPEIFKTAATRALTQRGWTITTSDADQIVGSLKKDKEYRARISYKQGVLIKIAFVENFGSKRPNWLVNLKEDLEAEMKMATLK